MAETYTVVDYFAPHDRAFMDCLVANGVGGIARYLVEAPLVDPRACTAQEVADAHAAGLSVHFFYEMNPTYAAYFTFAQGQHDARAALAHLRMLGAPQPTVVYFTVDAPPSRVPVTVLDEYFNGIEDVMRNEDDGLLVDGIYGYEAHVEYARTRFPGVGKHLAQTYGTPRGPLDLFQHEQLAMCGVSVDLDDCTVDGWRDDMTPEQVLALIRSPQGVAAVKDAILAQPDGYGPALQKELEGLDATITDDAAKKAAAAIATAVAKVGT